MRRSRFDLEQQHPALAAPPARDESASEPDAREVRLVGEEARERHPAQRLDGFGGSSGREQRRAALEELTRTLARRALRQRARQGGEPRAREPGFGRRGVLAVEPLEGGRARHAIAAGELQLAELEERLGRGFTARARGALERQGRLLLLLNACQKLRRLGQRDAGDGARRLGGRPQRGRGGFRWMTQGLVRARDGELGVVGQQRDLDVGMRQLRERLLGSAGLEQLEAGREPGQPARRRPSHALRCGVERNRRARSAHGVAHGGFPRVARLDRETPGGTRRGQGFGQQQQGCEGRAQGADLTGAQGPRRRPRPGSVPVRPGNSRSRREPARARGRCTSVGRARCLP